MSEFNNMSTFGQQNICHNAQIGISVGMCDTLSYCNLVA